MKKLLFLLIFIPIFSYGQGLQPNTTIQVVTPYEFGGPGFDFTPGAPQLDLMYDYTTITPNFSIYITNTNGLKVNSFNYYSIGDDTLLNSVKQTNLNRLFNDPQYLDSLWDKVKKDLKQ